MMKTEITTIHLPAVSNGAHFVFIESICKRLDSETELLKNEYLKKAADTLKGAFNEENRYFALSKKNASTDEILAADADRDTLYSAYYRSVKSFLRVSSADLHTAAKTLWQSLVDYGIKPQCSWNARRVPFKTCWQIVSKNTAPRWPNWGCKRCWRR